VTGPLLLMTLNQSISVTRRSHSAGVGNWHFYAGAPVNWRIRWRRTCAASSRRENAN